MKILYVSDLDGTLLRKNETLSSYTIKTINALTSSGMSFSYATARSLNTAKKVTEGLNTHFPLIIYNGAFVKDNITEEILIANYFAEDIYEVLRDLFAHEIYPIIYSYQNNIEKFSYITAKATSGMQAFLKKGEVDSCIPVEFAHSNNPEMGEEFRKETMEAFSLTESSLHEVGMAIGTHIGPDALLMAFILKESMK